MLITSLFQGQRVRLTTLTHDDIPFMTQWYEDTEFARLLDSSIARPRDGAHWRRWLDERQGERDVYVLAIRLVADDRFIGWIEIDGISWQHRHAWFAIGIGDSAYRSQGYGAEAMTLALDFCFFELNLYRVQLTVFEYNTRAIRLYERLGFVHEGSHRQYLQRDGQRYDMRLYGLLAPEWTISDS